MENQEGKKEKPMVMTERAWGIDSSSISTRGSPIGDDVLGRIGISCKQSAYR
jgi:hypothetical protein